MEGPIVYFAPQPTIAAPREMTFSNSVLSVLVLVSLGLALLAVILLLPAALRDRAGRSRSQIPLDKRLEILIDAQGKAIRRLEGAVRQLALGERHLGQLAEEAVRHVGMVRFDAFEDMGGRLSFSAALLDGHGDGVVITSINGRQDTRCYAKQVRGGASAHNLSDEERQAIRDALSKGQRQAAEAAQ
jgi:Protein of unknown function (DUF4446)